LGFWFEKASGGVIMRGNAAIVLPAVVLVMMAVGFLAALGPPAAAYGSSRQKR
jgi:hypothetical protein